MKTMIAMIAGALAFFAVSLFAGEWKKIEAPDGKTGPTFGRAGLAVDRLTGELYVSSGRRGAFLSADGGESWNNIGKDFLKGAQWYGLCVNIDTERSGRVAVFRKDPPEDPVQSGFTLDKGGTWHPLERVLNPRERKSHNYGWSWGVVDWSKEHPDTILARMHHSSRQWLSNDSGKTWAELPLQSIFMGLADAETVVAGIPRRKQILQSRDSGKEWEKTADLETLARIPALFKGLMYWGCAEGLAVSEDRGASWKIIPGSPEQLYWGPYFGKDESEMIVINFDGLYISRDSGASWKKTAENILVKTEPAFGTKELKMDWFIGESTWGWDPVNSKFYALRKGLFVTDL